MGINGNEKADIAAKEATTLQISDVKIPHSDLRQTVRKYVNQRWQSQWDNVTFNKLKNIKPTIGSSKLPKGLQRKEQTILHRLRLGHTRYTHSFLLKKEDCPECNTCQTADTVDHFLVHCQKFQQTRTNCLKGKSLPEILTQTPVQSLIEYVKEIGLYHKL